MKFYTKLAFILNISVLCIPSNFALADRFDGSDGHDVLVVDGDVISNVKICNWSDATGKITYSDGRGALGQEPARPPSAIGA